MKILVFDPLYSKMGHFYRYNKFILKMLSDIDDVEEIIYISNENEGTDYIKLSPKIKVINNPMKNKSIQIKSMQTTNFFNKISFHFNSMKSYKMVVKLINTSDCDFVFFTSNGLISFWLAIRNIKKRYIVSAISLKWIYDKYSMKFPLYFFYKKYLNNAKLIFVTENYYRAILRGKGLLNVEVLNDRYLEMYTTENKNAYSKVSSAGELSLLTLGTISLGKNPIDFIKILRKINFQNINAVYKIYGKALGNIDIGNELKKSIEDIPNIFYNDEYISDTGYNKLIKASDFMVIPYNKNYVKQNTSGVMWDCFEKQKLIICPDLEPFRTYVKTYNIGFLYTEKTLGGILDQIIDNKRDIINKMTLNYKNLYEDKNYFKAFEKFSNQIRREVNDNSEYC